MFVENEKIEALAKALGTDVDHVKIGLELKPIANQVVLIRHKDDESAKSKGGIVLTDKEAPRRVTGIVMAVGDGQPTVHGHLIPCMVTRFDKVRFRDNFGEEMSIRGYEFYVIKDNDVMVVLP